VHIDGVEVQSAQELGAQLYKDPHDAQLVVVPVQPLGDQEHPYSEEHADDVMFEPQGVTVPEHVDVQLQPYCAEHAVDVVFAVQGVSVPPHVPAFHVQPLWYEQVDDDVIEAQGVSVPVHVVVHEQPALLQRLEEA
jgi:hypothetical protein